MSTLRPTDPASSTTATGPSVSNHRWRRRGGRVSRPAAAVIARGEPTLWLTAGALAVAVFMIIGLIVLVVVMGGRTFWPARLEQVELHGDRVLLGEAIDEESYTLTERSIELLAESDQPAAIALLDGRTSATSRRTLYRIDNKQLNGDAFRWVSDFQRRTPKPTFPEWAVVVERTSWGRFLGTPDSFEQRHPRPVSGDEDRIARQIAFFEASLGTLGADQQATVDDALAQLRQELTQTRSAATADFLKSFRGESGDASRVAVLPSGETVSLDAVTDSQSIDAVRERWSGAATAWEKFELVHRDVRDRAARIHALDKHGLARISDRIESSRMDVVRAGLTAGRSLLSSAVRLAELDAAVEALDAAEEDRAQIVAATSRSFGADAAISQVARSIAGAASQAATAERKSIGREVAELEEAIPPAGADAIASYRSVSLESRRQTVEITSDMTALQAENERFVWRLAAAEGTIREVPVAEVVRAFPANQLDTFGRLGVYLSRWKEFLTAEPREANTEGGVFPAIWGTIAMTLVMTLAVVPFGVLAALYLREYAKAGWIVSAVRIAVNNLAGVPSIVFGVFGLGFFCYVIGARIDELFYPAYAAENRPVFGTGGLFWASLTLALLTLPVVIVATEEALSAVPNSMREGAYACGSSKWQTIRRIILPQALPGIMTGTILAMARGAGEVAPLMLVGAVKIAPDLPFDGEFPFIHPSRSFMHLGFHIYDLGFQSPDSVAAKPMVFTTTLLLITIVAVLNVAAIRLRTRLRKRFATSQF